MSPHAASHSVMWLVSEQEMVLGDVYECRTPSAASALVVPRKMTLSDH